MLVSNRLLYLTAWQALASRIKSHVDPALSSVDNWNNDYLQNSVDKTIRLSLWLLLAEC